MGKEPFDQDKYGNARSTITTYSNRKQNGGTCRFRHSHFKECQHYCAVLGAALVALLKAASAAIVSL